LNIVDAIEKHQNSSVHIFTDWGVYVGNGWGLKFDKEEYNKHFEYGCYLPDEKEWLLKNALLIFCGDKPA
jgi:hypothetical protein